MVVDIYYEQQLEIPSARSWEWAAPVRATGMVRKRQAAWTVHQGQNHAYRVILHQPARRAVVLGKPSSLRPHCIQYILQHRNTRDGKIE